MTSKPSLTNSPKTFRQRGLPEAVALCSEKNVLRYLFVLCDKSTPYCYKSCKISKSMRLLAAIKRYLGGYCGGVPPLPIPNREVKPTCADGTAMQCGRVGSRLLYSSLLESETLSGRLFCCFVVWWFCYLVVWFLPRQAAEPSGLVVLLFCYMYHGLTPETQGRMGKKGGWKRHRGGGVRKVKKEGGA